MRSFDTQAWVPLVVTGVLGVPLLAGCVYPCSCGSDVGVAPVSAAPPRPACPLLSKAEVAQATGHAVDSDEELGALNEEGCAYSSSSGFEVELTVFGSVTADLRSGSSWFTAIIGQEHLAPVSGVGDQAYGNETYMVVRKGHTAFVIEYGNAGGANQDPAGKREQALKQMASDVLKRLPAA